MQVDVRRDVHRLALRDDARRRAGGIERERAVRGVAERRLEPGELVLPRRRRRRLRGGRGRPRHVRVAAGHEHAREHRRQLRLLHDRARVAWPCSRARERVERSRSDARGRRTAQPLARAHPPAYPTCGDASHPKKLNGTKFFTWGFAEHGTFQQDFMSASDYTNANCSQDYYDPWCAAYEHEGMYSELQIGPALTQRHTFALPANSSFEWTEWFQGWQADPKEMHAPDYSRPLAAANAWRSSARAVASDRRHRRVPRASRPQRHVVYEGMPWAFTTAGRRLGPAARLAPKKTPQTTGSTSRLSFRRDRRPSTLSSPMRQSASFAPRSRRPRAQAPLPVPRHARTRGGQRRGAAAQPVDGTARRRRARSPSSRPPRRGGPARYGVEPRRRAPTPPPTRARRSCDPQSERAGWLIRNERWTELGPSSTPSPPTRRRSRCSSPEGAARARRAVRRRRRSPSSGTAPTWIAALRGDPALARARSERAQKGARSPRASTAR